MANSRKIKIKLLKLYDILKTETDKDHPLTTYELVEKLQAQDMSCDRRTLSKDIEALNDLGLSVKDTKCGHKKAYYVDNSTFSVPELKILIDAVQAASFIPKDMSENIIEKIAALGGTYRSEVLLGNKIAFNTRKHSNTNFLTVIDLINKAISKHKKISFYYFDLNENKERVYRKRKKRYKESPAALVFNDDNYYVVCYSSKHKKQLNYRIDRMDVVRIEEESAAPETEILADNLPEYTKQAFRMFSGEPEEVTLRFDRSILNQIYDQFGEDIEVISVSDEALETTVLIQVSPTFMGWLYQFGDKISVINHR